MPARLNGANVRHHHPTDSIMIALQVFTILMVLIGIIHLRGIIMSKATDVRDAVQAAFAKVNTALTGIQGDITSLKAKIDALNNSSGTLTLSPEDQAALDEIQNDANALADKAAALDDLTPPDDASGAAPGE